MGYNAYAYAVIGIKVPSSVFSKKHPQRGCEHPEVKGAKFCPECGAPTWKEEEFPPDRVEIEENLPKNLKDLGVEVVDSGTDSDSTYIGFVVMDGAYKEDEHQFRELPGQADLENLRKTLCEQFPSAENFGLWSVLYESY